MSDVEFSDTDEAALVALATLAEQKSPENNTTNPKSTAVSDEEDYDLQALLEEEQSLKAAGEFDPRFTSPPPYGDESSRDAPSSPAPPSPVQPSVPPAASSHRSRLRRIPMKPVGDSSSSDEYDPEEEQRSIQQAKERDARPSSKLERAIQARLDGIYVAWKSEFVAEGLLSEKHCCPVHALGHPTAAGTPKVAFRWNPSVGIWRVTCLTVKPYLTVDFTFGQPEFELAIRPQRAINYAKTLGNPRVKKGRKTKKQMEETYLDEKPPELTARPLWPSASVSSPTTSQRATRNTNTGKNKEEAEEVLGEVSDPGESEPEDGEDLEASCGEDDEEEEDEDDEENEDQEGAADSDAASDNTGSPPAERKAVCAPKPRRRRARPVSSSSEGEETPKPPARTRRSDDSDHEGPVPLQPRRRLKRRILVDESSDEEGAFTVADEKKSGTDEELPPAFKKQDSEDDDDVEDMF